MTAFQTLKNKIDKLTNVIDFGDFRHSLQSVYCYFNSVCMLLYEEKKLGQDQPLQNIVHNVEDDVIIMTLTSLL